METFTVMMPAATVRRHDLALLHAPVYATHVAGAAGEPVGRSEGVLLDEVGCVIAFIVRLQPLDAAGSPSLLLVPAAAVAHADGGALHLSWPSDRILALPRLDEDLRPLEPLPAGALPLARSSAGRSWLRRQSTGEAGAQGLEWGAAGAALGAVGGMIIGGPLGALALAAFFAAGGALAGTLMGGGGEVLGQEPPPRLSRDLRPEAVRRLDELLRDPALVFTGVLHATRVMPMITSPGA